MKCSRSACQKELFKKKYRIWNNPTHFPPHRDYCVGCGRKIIDFNRNDKVTGIVLEYQIMIDEGEDTWDESMGL